MKYTLLLALFLIGTGCSPTHDSTSVEPNQSPLPKGTDVMDVLSEQEYDEIEQAYTLLMEYPEIEKWKALFNGPENTSVNGGRAAVVNIGMKGNEYEFKAYESLPGHNATFGWYCVNLETKTVRDCSLD